MYVRTCLFDQLYKIAFRLFIRPHPFLVENNGRRIQDWAR